MKETVSISLVGKVDMCLGPLADLIAQFQWAGDLPCSFKHLQANIYVRKGKSNSSTGEFECFRMEPRSEKYIEVLRIERSLHILNICNTNLKRWERKFYRSKLGYRRWVEQESTTARRVTKLYCRDKD